MVINYSRNASVYDKRHLGVSSEIMFSVLDLTYAKPAMRILDMAAGTGRVSIPLAEAGLKVTSVDVSDKMLQQIAVKTDQPIETHVASAEDLPFKDSSFPLIALARALYLIEDWEGALHEMARVLKPDGYFLHEWGSGEPGTVIVRLRERLRERLLEMGVQPIFHPGARCEADVMEKLIALGFKEKGAITTGRGIDMTLQGFIDKIANRECSYLWGVSTDISDQAITELTNWTEQEFGNLNQNVHVPGETFWRVYSRA